MCLSNFDVAQGTVAERKRAADNLTLLVVDKNRVTLWLERSTGAWKRFSRRYYIVHGFALTARKLGVAVTILGIACHRSSGVSHAIFPIFWHHVSCSAVFLCSQGNTAVGKDSSSCRRPDVYGTCPA